MEDKRITKTKRNIKATLTALLQEMPFEKISVAEICRRGDISRITFYAHYEDKYALAEEIFSDHIQEAQDKYHTLQAENNPKNNGFIGYQNLLDAILSLYYDNYTFFSHTTSSENPYLFSSYFNRMNASVDDYLRRHTYHLPETAFPVPPDGGAHMQRPVRRYQQLRSGSPLGSGNARCGTRYIRRSFELGHV